MSELETMNEHLLSSVQMAQFVSSGYLKFDEMISKDLCAACLVEMRDNKGYLAVGTPFEDTWPKGTALGDAFRLPQVRGLIHSLVGPDPLYDHHAAHLTPAGVMKGPNTHQDSVIDFRENYFDIQLSLGCGGSVPIPGMRNATYRSSSCSTVDGAEVGVSDDQVDERRFRSCSRPSSRVSSEAILREKDVTVVGYCHSLKSSKASKTASTIPAMGPIIWPRVLVQTESDTRCGRSGFGSVRITSSTRSVISVPLSHSHRRLVRAASNFTSGRYFQ